MSNKKIIVAIISAVYCTVEMISCTHSPQTQPVSFSKDIVPIFTASCAISSACHMGANSANQETNFNADSAYYTISKKGLVSISNPTSSLLYVEVRTNEMPLQPYLPLPASQQSLILEWIEQGAKNN